MIKKDRLLSYKSYSDLKQEN